MSKLNVEKMLFQNQKFNILKAKTVNDLVSDAYAYAWYSGVYPFFHEGAEWHEPYKNYFDVTEEMMDGLTKYLDDNWLKKVYFSFYELEEHYKIKGSANSGGVWSRHQLIVACRYMYIKGSWDQTFWNTLCENMKCPAEAHGICIPFKPEEIYFE